MKKYVNLIFLYKCISTLTSMDTVIIFIFTDCLQITLGLFIFCKHSNGCIRKVWCSNSDCNKPREAKTQNAISPATRSEGTVHVCGHIPRKHDAYDSNKNQRINIRLLELLSSKCIQVAFCTG